MADGPEEQFHSGDETRSGSGSRHDAHSTETASSQVIRGNHRSERDQDGSDGPRDQVEVAGDTVAEVEEILEGEMLDERRVEEIISHESWKGPLPPPAALAAYERVLPGAADRAFTLAERSLDLKLVRADTVRAAVDGEVAINTITAEADRDALKRGQYLAACISALIGGLSFAGLFLTPWAAIGFTVPLAQVAGALIRTVSDRNDVSDDRPTPPHASSETVNDSD